MEEFRLDGSGVRQELDIVDEQHAGVQVAAAEVVVLAVPGRDRELAAEFRGAYVADVQRWVQLLRVVADGMQQVGPAQAETAVDEQRVACRAVGFGNGDRGSVGEAVTRVPGWPEPPGTYDASSDPAASGLARGNVTGISASAAACSGVPLGYGDGFRSDGVWRSSGTM